MAMRTEQKAVLYAAQKEIERMLKDDGDLPVGFAIDVSGMKLELTFPPGTVVNRDAGPNGDGMIEKKAAQNLYGYAILHAITYYLYKFLRLFRQERKAEEQALKILRRIVKHALQSGVSSEDAFKQLHPRLADGIAEVREKIRDQLPKRPEPTPRLIQRANKQLLATVKIVQAKTKKQKAA